MYWSSDLCVSALMDQIGRERFQIAPHPPGDSACHAIFAAPADQRHRGHVDQIAGRGEGGFGDGGRIDAHVHPAREQMPDEQVERLIGAVTDIVIVAAEQRHAEIARLHSDRKSTRLNSKSLMRISYAVFCLKKKKKSKTQLLVYKNDKYSQLNTTKC